MLKLYVLRLKWAHILLLLVIGGTALAAGCANASGSPELDQPGPPTAVADGNGNSALPEPTETDSQPTEPEPPASQPSSSPAPTAMAGTNRQMGSGVGEQAPELTGITNWINSEPLTLEGLRGKVVLLDVWTYSCVNCIRTFPFLKEWHSRYADDGLVIIGLHAPEFEFEKDPQNVKMAAREHGIAWPIAQDNDFKTWRAYENRYWPAKYLIDKDGVVRYTHFGEGAYAETEEQIRRLLADAGANLSDDETSLPSDQVRDQSYEELRAASPGGAEITPELYAGYERNYSAVLYGADPYVVQTEYYRNRDSLATLSPPENLVPHKIYFNGQWLVDPEHARHARNTEDFTDYITLKYSAKSVNAVITSQSGQPHKVRVIMDGEYLTEANKGQDVTIGPNGESFILVTEPRLYSIVENPRYMEERVLELRTKSDDFSLFAFTFGVYQEGP